MQGRKPRDAIVGRAELSVLPLPSCPWKPANNPKHVVSELYLGVTYSTEHAMWVTYLGRTCTASACSPGCCLSWARLLPPMAPAGLPCGMRRRRQPSPEHQKGRIRVLSWQHVCARASCRGGATTDGTHLCCCNALAVYEVEQ